MAKEGKEEVTLTLTLTRNEWCEVANCIESKHRLIERGDYGEGEEDDENEEWLLDLESAYEKVAEVLDKNGVTY